METDSRGVARVVGGATLLSREFIESAHVAIRPHVRETPLEPSPYLTELTGAEVFLKLENYQVTGSFKARGAMHKLTRLDAEARGRGVICASSGNHGAAVAYGAQKLGLASTVCVPEYASSTKVDVIRRFGAEVQFFGDDCVKTEGYARKVGQERGLTYVSPYNDVDVAAGQGTIGVELSAQLDGMDVVFIALGGGGLIGGVGAYLNATSARTEIVACSPEKSPAMHACLEAGEIIDVRCGETLSDATAGGVEAEAITFELCRSVVDRSLVISEAAIEEGMLALLGPHRMMVEGAAGLALAGLLVDPTPWQGKRVVVLVCGANISVAKLRDVLA